jgi:hypothetical protein
MLKVYQSGFMPDKKKIETLSYQTQFGHAFDQYGHWFGCNNSNQGYHEVIANRYFQRNKGSGYFQFHPVDVRPSECA